MSQLVEQSDLSDEGRFRCGDGEALMTYVYGESSPGERDAIAAHVARCVACAEEVEAIGSTREQLAAWTPPSQTLGFQIPARPEPLEVIGGAGIDSAPIGATVLRPAAWWRRPLPAWAQVAAAAVIFASGLAIGMARGTSPAVAVAPEAAPPVAAPVSATQAPVTREELARVEQRLIGEIAQVRTAAPTPAAPTAAMMQRVSQMIAASERRQMQELNFRSAQLVSDFSDRRKIDLVNIEKRFGATNVKVLGNQDQINSLAQRVNYTPTYSPYVP